ncbi:MAG TPA: YegP family protein [Burkholderiaceae bacterium]|nr:YegP family protein [Burkholderiaceae bacterium]
MSGYFVLKRAAGSQFMFNLKAGNHEVILTSETYASRQGATNGIESVRAAALADASFVRKTASNGQSYFVILAGNRQTIGKSEFYTSTAAMEKGIRSVRNNAPSATIKDLTGEA